MGKRTANLQKLCNNLKSEAQHIRNDNLEEMSITYARTFMVSKVIQEIQSIVLKEINYFVVSGINKLGKLDESEKEEKLESKDNEQDDNSTEKQGEEKK